MDQQKLQTALAADKSVDKIKTALGDQFKEGDTLKVKTHDHGISATWHRPSDGQRVTANVKTDCTKTPVTADKKLTGAPENK